MSKRLVTPPLANLYPEVAAEWHLEKNGNLTPDMVKPHSNKYAWFRCSRGHEWRTKINNRTSNHTLCPYCTGNQVIVGSNDFASQCSTLLAEWDFAKNGDLDPAALSCQSNRKVWWKCSNGHNWQARVDHRTNGQNCPYCAGLKPIPGTNDLATVYPEVAALWDPTQNQISPDTVFPRSHKEVHWICPRGHRWKALIATVVRSYDLNPKRTGCPVCSGKIVHSDNCLATVAPNLAAEWGPQNELTPFDVTFHSNTPVWWQCGHCGHEWQAKPNNRARGSGCPACQRLITTPENNLVVLAPELAAEFDTERNGIGPESVAARSNLSYWWKCSDGHEWKAVVSNRYLKKQGCPYCSGHKVIPGKTDFASLHPNLVPEWDIELNAPLTPDTVAAKSNTKVWWQCPNGHLYKTTIATRSYGGGCPICQGRTPRYQKEYTSPHED